MLTLSRSGRLALGVFLPAPLFMGPYLIGVWLSAWGESGSPPSPGSVAFVFLYGSFLGCLLVGLPAGIATMLIEALHDRGVGRALTVVVGALLGAGCGTLALKAGGLGLRTSTLVMAAVVGAVVAWLLRALRGPGGSGERVAPHRPDPLP